MGKGIVIFIIFLLLAGILVFAYFKYEKPIKKDGELVIYYTNLTIFAEDMEKNQIKTTYLVFVNNTLYDGGITDIYGGVRQRVATNNTYSIRNENLYGQNYYTSEIDFTANQPEKNNKITLKLEEFGELGINQSGIFGIDKNISLELSENKSFQHLMYCLKWSELLIFVNSEDKKTDNIVDDNYKCYNPDINLNEKQNYTININYDLISPITSNDYLRVQFYDKDELLSQNYTKRQEYFLK